MKIIQITDHNGSGGVNSFVYDLCLAQVKGKLDVTFISIIDYKAAAATEELDKLKCSGVKVHCLGARTKLQALICSVTKLRKLIKQLSADDQCICNLHLKLSVLMGVVATVGLRNVRCVETYHNSYHHYGLQYALCYPFIKHYIAISRTCGEEMKRRFHTSDSKLSIVSNGIDRLSMRQIASRGLMKDTSVITVMSIGRLSYEKNFSIPIEALSEICDEKLRYIIIGDGPERGKIERVAGKNKNIRFCGWMPREKTLEALASADVVIMPSLWEGRSILQMEAMAMGKVLILSDVPALREVFDEKGLEKGEVFRRCRWGYLVETSNSGAYREAVLSFRELSAKDRAQMQKEIEKYSDLTDMQLTVEGYKELYEQIMLSK